MDKEFQENFSGLRRYWLESLLRELIYVSSFEQFSQAMIEAQSKILSASQNPCQDKGLSVLAANIEGLLFHRLGKDLVERNDISSLFEQIQVSQILTELKRHQPINHFSCALQWAGEDREASCGFATRLVACLSGPLQRRGGAGRVVPAGQPQHI
ncbi:hypothetical protein GJ744_004953 [Endocarpon pusillum]|uniref:Uncharacterized protein n=1 Tax=Endocarpon pusillum TaxID=364733 RepID=A0A8H7DXE3_9EURO|nr:hypothetical protein GJ744_004953 [Endocarpon pusillum]